MTNKGPGRWGIVLVSACLASPVFGDDAVLDPIADALVAAAHPTSNYGGAGSLAIAAAGLPQGEFQALFKFDAASAIAAFDQSFGPGRWIIQAISLRLTSADSVNPIFNEASAGQFAIVWQKNDGWTEGTGRPNEPGTSGVTFADIAMLGSPEDESLGIFDFNGVILETVYRELALSPGLVSDVSAGNEVSLRVVPSDSSVAYQFNARSFPTAASRPFLTITAVAAPCYANCDHSTAAPMLNANDFQCFLNEFAAGNAAANCDGSTAAPALNANDFQCFLNEFAAGCV